MRSLPLIFLGIFFTLAFSFTGVVLVPFNQIGGLEPMSAEFGTTEAGEVDRGSPTSDEPVNPQPLPGLARQGKDVYISHGCMYCHSQQVRRPGFGSDFERNWGRRQTVARDYIWQERVLLGTMRTGPDLSNVGVRLPTENWHHIHLYNPQTVSPGSIMPPYRFLYEVREVDNRPSANALQMPAEFAPPEGFEIVPTAEAEALVAYLLSLKVNYDLPEVKMAD